MQRLGFFCVLFSFGLAACAETLNTHGNLVREDQLVALNTGSATKMDVLQTLGSPTTKSLFDNEKWYYITSKSLSKPLNENDIVERKTYILAFDEKGVLANIAVRTEDDGRALRPESKETATQGQALGVIDQILQNLGQP